MTEGGLGKVERELKDLPLWFKWVCGIAGLVVLPSAIFGIVPMYQAGVNLLDPQYTEATSTPNIADIFSQYNNYSRWTDQQNFLVTYSNKEVVGKASFQNFSKITGSTDAYRTYAKVATGLLSSENIICSFTDTDGTVYSRLKLFKKWQKFNFIGNFTGSTEGFGVTWYLSDCHFIN